MMFNLSKRTQVISNDSSISNKFGKFLPYIFGIFLFLAIFTPNNFVNGLTPPKGFECKEGEVAKLTVGGDWVCNKVDASGKETTTTKNGESTTQTSKQGQPSWLASALFTILSAITGFIFTMMGWVLSVSGMLLNLVINETVLKMADGLKGMTGIDTTWRVIRDVVNIFFIFILVFEGIRIIISQSSLDKAKQIIVGVIITSVLINFSVFFTKIVIDASNIATIGFYKSIYTASQKQDVSVDPNTLINGGISGAFANALKISSIYDARGISNLGENPDEKMTIINIGGSVMYLVLAFVFFAISAMFVIRYVTLLILLMFSPLGFIGWGIPKLKSIQDTWWKTLMGQAIFAPLYMFLTWVVLTLISSDGFISFGKDANFATLATGIGGKADISSLGLIINFVVIIALVIFTLTESKKYAGQGSTFIGTATGKLTAFAGGAVMGGGAMLGRNSLGRLGNLAANNEKLKNLAAKDGIGGFAGKLALKTSAGASKATFDARNTKSVGTLTGALGGMDIGKGTKNTYKSVMDDKEKKAKAFAESLKSSPVAIDIAKEKSENAAKNTQAATRELEEKRKDPAFVAKEAKEKEDYLNSAEYKNSDIYKNAEAENEANKEKSQKIKDEVIQEEKLNKELEDLNKQKAQATSMMDKKKEKELIDQIDIKKKEIEAQKIKIKEVKDANKLESTATETRIKHENEWSKYLVKYREAEEEAKKYETSLKTAFANRIEEHAKNVAEGSMIWNFITNGIGYDTDSERAALAAKIRSTSKGKTDDEVIAEALKRKQDKIDKEKGVKTDEPKKDESATPDPKVT